MARPLPQGAEPILKARMRGMKPADMVIISMTGPVPAENPAVRIKFGETYDWRWVRGLDVCLYIDEEVDWFLVLKEIALQRPGHLSLWAPVGEWGSKVYLIPAAGDVAKPVRQWIYELDFLPWMDFQNNDFMTGRVYGRDSQGVPYAVNP